MPQFGVPPRGALSLAGDAHSYTLLDAAYVLGALSASDRRDFEDHLGTCMSCKQAVSELSGMPALLSRLDTADVAAIDDQVHPPSAAPALPATLLTSVVASVTRRQRRARLKRSMITTAAAAVLMIGAFLVQQSHFAAAPPESPQAAAGPLAMTRVTPSPISATVTLSSHEWGTGIEMNCAYEPAPDSSGRSTDNTPGESLAMVVVRRDGTSTQLATWEGLVGVDASPRGSTSTPMSQIAAVQVVSVDTGNVLLQRNL